MFSDGEPVKGVHFLLFSPEQQLKVNSHLRFVNNLCVLSVGEMQAVQSS